MNISASCLSKSQLAAIRLAARRPGRGVEPLPHGIRGAAKAAVIDALLRSGYATRCFLATHVEYVLTNDGLELGARLNKDIENNSGQETT